jgi:hypothetical protein
MLHYIRYAATRHAALHLATMHKQYYQLHSRIHPGQTEEAEALTVTMLEHNNTNPAAPKHKSLPYLTRGAASHH